MLYSVILFGGALTKYLMGLRLFNFPLPNRVYEKRRLYSRRSRWHIVQSIRLRFSVSCRGPFRFVLYSPKPEFGRFGIYLNYYWVTVNKGWSWLAYTAVRRSIKLLLGHRIHSFTRYLSDHWRFFKTQLISSCVLEPLISHAGNRYCFNRFKTNKTILTARIRGCWPE